MSDLTHDGSDDELRQTNELVEKLNAMIKKADPPPEIALKVCEMWAVSMLRGIKPQHRERVMEHFLDQIRQQVR